MWGASKRGSGSSDCSSVPAAAAPIAGVRWPPCGYTEENSTGFLLAPSHFPTNDLQNYLNSFSQGQSLNNFLFVYRMKLVKN